MTLDPRAPSPHGIGRSLPSSRGTRLASIRPSWLLPALVIGLVVALVVVGVVSLSTALYSALFGGMILMHVRGHAGHGGHKGQAGAGLDSGYGPDASQGEDLSWPSPGSQHRPPSSTRGLGERALDSDDPNGSETHDHDQHAPHSYHGRGRIRP